MKKEIINKLEEQGTKLRRAVQELGLLLHDRKARMLKEADKRKADEIRKQLGV
jgi:hypothetical protein